MKKRYIVLAVTLVLILSLSILPTGMPKAAAQAKTLKMGLIVPLTGAGASWGIPWEKTWRLYWEEVNASLSLLRSSSISGLTYCNY